MIHWLYRVASIMSTFESAYKGGSVGLGRNYVRRKAHKGLARGMRRMGL